MKNLTLSEIKKFRKIVYAHATKMARSLPWRTNPTPYRVLVSEIMLQQTQAERVVPKFNAFVKQFPNFKSLSLAKTSEVLKMWSGLGYNRRALNLKKATEIIMTLHKGLAPKTIAELDELPGIGPATAAAILAYAHNLPTPFIETNVRAVYIYYFFPEKKNISDTELLPLVIKTLDAQNPRRWYNALMDYGVHLKKEFKNPSRRSAHHATQSKFKGSNRELRGAVIRLLSKRPRATTTHISKTLGKDAKKINLVLATLEAEGLVTSRANSYSLPN